MRKIPLLALLIVAEVGAAQAVAAPLDHADCVDALEQIVVLRTAGPVYIEEDRFHREITTSERRSELARLTKVAQASCSKDPKVRAQQNVDAQQLYVARSPECRVAWARYAEIMMPRSGYTREQRARRQGVLQEKCPATRLDHRWLIGSMGTVHDPDLSFESPPK